jgi:hypothetical protein
VRKEQDMGGGMIEKAKSAKHVIISLVQPQRYGSQDEILAPNGILTEKMKEIVRTRGLQGFESGQSFWYYGTPKCGVTPSDIRRILSTAKREAEDLYCMLVESPYKSSDRGRCLDTAARYSEDGPKDTSHWLDVPDGMHVTGSLDDVGYAMVFDRIEGTPPDEPQTCIWNWSVHGRPGEAIRNRIGGSTHLCVLASSRRDPNRMYESRNGLTRLVGVGRLATPYAVWLR